MHGSDFEKSSLFKVGNSYFSCLHTYSPVGWQQYGIIQGKYRKIQFSDAIIRFQHKVITFLRFPFYFLSFRRIFSLGKFGWIGWKAEYSAFKKVLVVLGQYKV